MKQILSIVIIAGLFSLSACDHSAVQQKDAAIQAQQHTIDSMNAELAKKKVIDSMNEVVKTQYVMTPAVGTAPVTAAPAVVATNHSTIHRHAAHSTPHYTQSAAQPVVYQEAPKKKGWSAKAKGAVIGTATGAAAGAIINKRNRGAGAIIGGVLGAAAGTGTGAIIDKRNGR